MGAWALTVTAGAYPFFHGIRAVTLTRLERAPEVIAAGDSLLVHATGIEGRFLGLAADTAYGRLTLRPR